MKKPTPYRLSAPIDILTSPRYKWLQHTAYVLTCVIYVMYCVSLFESFIPDQNSQQILFYALLTIDIYPAYVNRYFLMPRFLDRQKYVSYAAALCALIISVALALYIVKGVLDNLYQCGQFIGIIQSLKVIIPLSIAGPMAFSFFKQWRTRESQISQIIQSTKKEELEYLKSQINPHFLFNTLNNMTVLIRTAPDEASRMILRLKDMLDYQLSDTARTQVPLKDEIRFLNNYLNMEASRRDSCRFTVNTEGNTDNVQVPPLIFIPFVENAVKHNPGIGYTPYIELTFTISGDELLFSCVNSKPAGRPKRPAVGGVGLANIERRLALLYQVHYDLRRTITDTEYKVELKIPLNTPTI